MRLYLGALTNPNWGALCTTRRTKSLQGRSTRPSARTSSARHAKSSCGSRATAATLWSARERVTTDLRWTPEPSPAFLLMPKILPNSAHYSIRAPQNYYRDMREDVEVLRDHQRFTAASLSFLHVSTRSRQVQARRRRSLGIPVVSVHNSWDYLVASFHEPAFAEIVASAGASSMLLQRSVQNYGHCNFPTPLVVSSFQTLTNWCNNRDQTNELSELCRARGKGTPR